MWCKLTYLCKIDNFSERLSSLNAKGLVFVPRMSFFSIANIILSFFSLFFVIANDQSFFAVYVHSINSKWSQRQWCMFHMVSFHMIAKDYYNAWSQKNAGDSFCDFCDHLPSRSTTQACKHIFFGTELSDLCDWSAERLRPSLSFHSRIRRLQLYGRPVLCFSIDSKTLTFYWSQKLVLQVN